MELQDIRARIDDVDEQILNLFLERMSLSEEVASYKREHHLPIFNKAREREILARVTEKAGERERYAYHLFTTLMELGRSRQAELISTPTNVAELVRAGIANGADLFPQTGLIV